MRKKSLAYRGNVQYFNDVLCGFLGGEIFV